MISEETVGVEATRHFDRFKILRELGRYASMINAIPTNGFGESFDWSANKLSRRASFAEFLELEFQTDKRIEILERNRICDAEKVKELRRLVDEMAGLKIRPRLNHSDLRLKNVFVNEAGKIVAILDWETAISNIAPHWELSIALHDLSIDEKQHFLIGYGVSERRFQQMSSYIKVFNLLNYTGAIDLAVRNGDKLALLNIKQRFSGVLDLYSVN